MGTAGEQRSLVALGTARPLKFPAASAPLAPPAPHGERGHFRQGRLC